jgi:hypothetical protein
MTAEEKFYVYYIEKEVVVRTFVLVRGFPSRFITLVIMVWIWNPFALFSPLWNDHLHEKYEDPARENALCLLRAVVI